MNKSTHTVTMPVNDYQELMQYKEYYQELLVDLRKCFDTNNFDNNSESTIRLDVEKVIKIGKTILPIKYNKAQIII